MAAVQPNGAHLHAEIEGSGEPILWIPGTAQLGSVWAEHQVPAFRDRYQCITVDLPGAGASMEAGEFTVADLARSLADLLDQRGGVPTHVVGFSLGASVAQELAIARPDLVRSLVLIGTWSSSAREHHIARHTRARLDSLERAPRDIYAAFSYWLLSPTVFDEEPALRDEVEDILAKHATTRAEGIARQYRANLGHETWERLGAIRCPTLVVYGEDDRITLPRYGEAVAAAIPGARIERIPRAGHVVALERPAQVNSLVAGFLADTRS